MRYPLKNLILTGSILICFNAFAGPDVTDVISRAEQFSYDSLSLLVRNQEIDVDWLSGDRYFHYSIEEASGRTHFVVDTRTWKKTMVLDCREMSERIARMQENERKDAGFPDRSDNIYSIGFKEGNPYVFEFRCGDTGYRYDCRKDVLEEADVTEEAGSGFRRRTKWYRSYSADSLYWISAVGHDLVLYSDGGRDSTRLTYDGEQFRSFALGGDSGKAPDALSAPTGRWVGDSHKFFLVMEDKRDVGTLTLVNSLAKPRPVPKTYKFAMPGDKHVPQYEVWLVDADRKSASRIPAEAYPDQKIVVPRLSDFFHTDRYVYFIRMSRPADIVDLCRVDVMDGSLKVLVSEKCSPHLNEQLFSYHILGDGEEILWWSERTGKGRYYLYDGEGRLKNAVTDDDFVSGHIVRIYGDTREIIFAGYGREEGINPHYTLYYKASLDGKGPLVCLTPGNGDHTISVSPDRKFIVDEMSRMDLAPQHRIFDMKGRERFRMEDCDLSELYRRGWKEPVVMKLHAADSVTDLYGVVYLPFDLDSTKKYPVISSVYPGPQTDLVPQSFSLDDNYNQSLAQMGFVVVNFSYRGSCPVRGRDFYDFGYGNLRDYPLDDDYAVIRQVGEIFPFADTTRVGIYGHSGGGFMAATAMMTRPDFYKAGVAASGNYDNNIYMQWWGESFHGVTVQGDSFGCDIPTTMELAGNLKGSLLLVTGDMDNNVHPASTLRLADALIKAGKYFDMMVIPGADHGLGDKYYINLIRLYFAGHLLGMDTENINNN